MFVESYREGEVTVRPRPTAKDLAYVLRHRELWPEGFKWNYYDTTRCAMGLACAMWPEYISYPTNSAVAEFLGIDYSDASRIFCFGNSNWFWSRTRPEQIAKSLEKL